MNPTVTHSMHGAELYSQIQRQRSDPSNRTNKAGCYRFIILFELYNFPFLLLHCHVHGQLAEMVTLMQ